MNLERGFRRLALVLSAGALFVGIVVDLSTMPGPPRSVRVTLADGRQVTREPSTGLLAIAVDLGEPLTTPWDREALAMQISFPPEFGWVPDPNSSGKIEVFSSPPPVQARDIREVRILRIGPFGG